MIACKWEGLGMRLVLGKQFTQIHVHSCTLYSKLAVYMYVNLFSVVEQKPISDAVCAMSKQALNYIATCSPSKQIDWAWFVSTPKANNYTHAALNERLSPTTFPKPMGIPSSACSGTTKL